MGQERVDKAWQTKGLTGYSTEAILGTLGHYGTAVDENGYRTLSKTLYPLAIAERWHQGWKGTGQFVRFPLAAADELWRRFEKERLLPADFALAVVQLASALEGMRAGVADAPVGARFKAVEEMKAKVPLKEGKAEEPFLAEVLFHMGEWIREVNHLAEDLAKEGHLDDAEEFAVLEEFLFPERAGTARTLVRAARGEKDEALGDLEKLARDESREPSSRLSAVDALIHLGAVEKATPIALALFDAAEAREDYHFALEVSQRVRYVLELSGARDKQSEYKAKVARVTQAHDRAHPHHH